MSAGRPFAFRERKIVLQEKETLIEKIGKILTKVGTAVMMNLLFLVCSLPIVTMGQAWCGLMSALRYQIRGDSWWDGFKFGFKTRFLRGTVAWCALLAVGLFLLIYGFATGGIADVLKVAVPLVVASLGHGVNLFTDRVMLSTYSPTTMAAAFPAGL